MNEHQALVHDVLIDGQENIAIYVKAVVNMIMERYHTASAYDLSRTANILNANMNQIVNMLSALSNQPYQQLELPASKSGISQEGARILEEELINIEHTMLPIPNPNDESES